MTKHKSTPIFLFTLDAHEYHGPFVAERSAHRSAEANALHCYQLHFKPLPFLAEPRFIPLESRA